MAGQFVVLFLRACDMKLSYFSNNIEYLAKNPGRTRLIHP